MTKKKKSIPPCGQRRLRRVGVFFIGEGAEAGNQWASLRVRGIVRSVRNRSDRLTINWVSARFPHPALRATFPPGEGFLGCGGGRKNASGQWRLLNEK